MSKMKSMLGMAAMMTALAYGGNSGTTPNYLENKETEEEKAQRIKSATIKRYLNNGLKEFKYSGGSVFALNQKSADRKAKKLNII